MHTPCSDTEKPRHMNKGPCCVPRGEGGSPSLLSHCGGRAEPRDGAEGRAGVLQARSPHGPRQHVARTGRTAQGFQHIPCLPHSTRTGHTRGRRSLGRRIRGGRRTQSMRGGAPSRRNSADPPPAGTGSTRSWFQGALRLRRAPRALRQQRVLPVTCEEDAGLGTASCVDRRGFGRGPHPSEPRRPHL